MNTNAINFSAGIPSQRTLQKRDKHLNFSASEEHHQPRFVEQETESTMTKSLVKRNGQMNGFKSEMAAGNKISKTLFIIPPLFMGLGLAGAIHQMVSFRQIVRQLSQMNKTASRALRSALPHDPKLEGWKRHLYDAHYYTRNALPYLNTIFMGSLAFWGIKTKKV